MLPKKFKETVFDKVSAITMRKFFNPIDLKHSDGLLRQVLIQSQKDFFINGTITSHAASPGLMAGMWMAGREITLVNGHLSAWLKKAMGAALSEVNKCPYCEDMLLSLTFGANEKSLANALKENDLTGIENEKIKRIMEWVKASKHSTTLEELPFTPAQVPEALGTLIVFGYTNRISDYLICFRKFHNLADYITINISSPNTENLRDFHNRNELNSLIDKLKKEKKELNSDVPLAIKVSPDLN
ncbi:MAG: hypothetical protein F3745_02820, partial [Nitrospinae bacterium]|nr:hypothetical protein [Nitrospinota bacterium]